MKQPIKIDLIDKEFIYIFYISYIFVVYIKTLELEVWYELEKQKRYARTLVNVNFSLTKTELDPMKSTLCN